MGVAQAVFEIVLGYTKEIAGKPVREHSLHASIIADMAIAIETARAYYMQVAWMADHPKIYGRGWSPARLARASAGNTFPIVDRDVVGVIVLSVEMDLTQDDFEWLRSLCMH